MKNHFIIRIEDERGRLLEFERFNLKTVKGAYNSFLKFLKRYTLQRYENGFNIGSKPYKVIATYQTYEPESETTFFEKSYEEFISDLKSI